MEIIEINDNLLATLHLQAVASERKRMNYDLRTTAEDNSQRMLNALEVGTKVPIHRHLETSETTICLQGCMDVVFYDLRPNEDCGGPFMGSEGTVIAPGMECNIYECYRVRLCPRDGKYGVQIPVGAWHTVEVYEPSTIFEAKDGAYRP
ncbi:MAG: WbuC family cupin fold metalloprotein [Lachnospiraceae bacterium]